MRLNDPLVTSFEYENEEYTLDMSFDNVLDVFDVFEDETLRDYERAEINLELLLNQSMKGQKAVELWNYIYEQFIKIEKRQRIEYDRLGNPMPSVEEDEDVKFIDVKQDAEYIYSSFQQAYGINLYKEQGKIHWVEFQALLNGLPSDTIMQRIIQIRMWKPSKGESVEYKESMKKLQRVYALDDEPGEVE